MDDAGVVRCLERLGNLPRHRQRLVDGDRPAGDARGQVLALDQFHHQRRKIAGLQAVDLGDVRMVEGREHFGFALESRQPLGVARQLRRQHLERHFAFQPGVPGPIDFAHPACAKQRDDFVRAQT